MTNLFPAFISIILALFSQHLTDAASNTNNQKRICWEGTASGKDIMNISKEMRNVTRKECALDEKTCLKWQIMQGDEYKVGYACGMKEQAKAEDCKNSTIVVADDAKATLPRPCDGSDKPSDCPTTETGKNVTITKCYCMGDNCNLSANLCPLGFWIMIAIVIATIVNSNVFA